MGLIPKCHPDKPYRANGLCATCYWKDYTKRHPTRDRARFLKKHYNLTLIEYDKLLKRQNGVCAICGAKPKTRSLNVDHNHLTKVNRGLLCHLCNRALGQLKADTRPDIGIWIDIYLKDVING